MGPGEIGTDDVHILSKENYQKEITD